MSEKYDEVLQAITELTTTIKEHANDKATLDFPKLEESFKAMLAEQQKAILENTPVRKGEMQGEAANKAVDNYAGKYRRELKDIARNGEHKIGTWRLKGVDLYLAKLLIDSAWRMKQEGKAFDGAEYLKGPASEDLGSAVKALTATGSGAGDELVPTGMASEMWQDFFSASRIAGDLPNQPMPTDPFDITLGFGARTWRKGTQSLATSAADPATAKSTLTSTEQITEDNWTYNLDEDAVIAMMPALRANLAQSGGEQMDAFCVNADATVANNINSHDLAACPADSYWLSDGQDGIRHYGLVDNTTYIHAISAALTDALMATFLSKLGKYALDLPNVRLVPGIRTYFTMLGLTNIATIEKYGAAATIVSGELAKYRGVSVIPSASVLPTAADGMADSTAGTVGQILGYNRNFWRVGFRRGLTIEVDRLIQRRLLVMVTSFRIAIATWGVRTSSGASHTAVGYNITL
jgi:hypothetical protein